MKITNATKSIMQLRYDLEAYKNTVVMMQDKINALQKNIDAPEPKTGRVMSVDDLNIGDRYSFVDTHGRWSESFYDASEYDRSKILCGLAFHERASCEQCIEYLKLEQELRVAQIADGGVPVADGKRRLYSVRLLKGRSRNHECRYYEQKVQFFTRSARDDFRRSIVPSQLTLLIRGV